MGAGPLHGDISLFLIRMPLEVASVEHLEWEKSSGISQAFLRHLGCILSVQILAQALFLFALFST